MNFDTYKQLAERLDALPNGFPSTDDGRELKLLAKIFTPRRTDSLPQPERLPCTEKGIHSRLPRPEQGLHSLPPLTAHTSPQGHKSPPCWITGWAFIIGSQSLLRSQTLQFTPNSFQNFPIHFPKCLDHNGLGDRVNLIHADFA